MDWGWNPDTVIAIATTLAMLAAITAGIFAGLSFAQVKKQTREAATQTAYALDQVRESEKQTEQARLQSESVAEQLMREQIDRERAQAESIAAWTTTERGRLEVLVQNSSLTPIYDVRLATRLGSERNPRYYYAARVEVVPPSSGQETWLSPAAATTSHYEDWADKRSRNRHPKVDLVFRDRSGIQWHRDRDGILSKFELEGTFPDCWRKADESPLDNSPMPQST